KRSNLLPVRITHLVENKRLHRTLKRSYLDYLRLDAQLVQRTLEENRLRAHTCKFQNSLRIQVHFIGYRSQVIRFLRINLTICDDEFLGFLEVEQSVTDLLHCCHSC